MVKILIAYTISISTLFVLIFILKSIKNKKLIHKVCLINVIILLIWIISRLPLDLYPHIYKHRIYSLFYSFGSITNLFLPATFLLLSILIIKDKTIQIKNYIIIFILPTISAFIYMTNNWHHLLFRSKYSINGEIEVGPLYLIIYFIEIAYIIYAMIYVIYSSFKYTRHFSKQIILFLIGMSIPILFECVSYAIYFFSGSTIEKIPSYSYCLTYTFMAVFITISVYKYKLMDKMPISSKIIIGCINDSFLVVDYKNNILEMNEIFKKTFSSVINIKLKLYELFNEKDFKDFNIELFKNLEIAKKDKKTIKFEAVFEIDGIKYFSIEITPIYVHERFMGVIIFIRDISIYKELIKLQEEHIIQQIEKNRLISLNNLIASLTHNIKTPIMASSGGISILENSTKEIDDYFKKSKVYSISPEYFNTIEKMKIWEEKIKQYLIYISDIISAMNTQITTMNNYKNINFTLEELLKQLTYFIKSELAASGCVFNKLIKLNLKNTIQGDMKVLIQILQSVIINAIHAYDDNGIIDFIVEEIPEGVTFVIKDYGKGIDEKTLEKIFYEMITTKGKNGSGLNLYLANIAIKGYFNGSISIKSKIGKGTEVCIKIPFNSSKLTNDTTNLPLNL